MAKIISTLVVSQFMRKCFQFEDLKEVRLVSKDFNHMTLNEYKFLSRAIIVQNWGSGNPSLRELSTPGWHNVHIRFTVGARISDISFEILTRWLNCFKSVKNLKLTLVERKQCENVFLRRILYMIMGEMPNLSGLIVDIKLFTTYRLIHPRYMNVKNLRNLDLFSSLKLPVIWGDKDEVSMLSKIFEVAPLNSFRISGCYLTKDCLLLIKRFLCKNQSLRSFCQESRAVHENFDSSYGSNMTLNIEHKYLKQFRLDYIEDYHMSWVFNYLKQQQDLEYLYLGIRKRYLHIFIDYLKLHGGSLKGIKIVSSDIAQDEFKLAFDSCKNLQVLHLNIFILDGNQSFFEGLNPLIETLPNTLTQLRINNGGYNSASSTCADIKLNKLNPVLITHLELNALGKCISDTTVRHIISFFKYLKVLQLSNSLESNCTDASFVNCEDKKKPSYSISNLQGIRTLLIPAFGSISDTTLIQGIRFRKLLNLDVRNNPAITERGIMCVIRQNPSLQTLRSSIVLDTFNQALVKEENKRLQYSTS